MYRLFIICLATVLSTGCSTILSGTSQTLTIDTNPTGARCVLEREGRVIGTIENTPGAVTVKKTKHDIEMVCTKDGYMTSKQQLESGTEGATFGNILAGGVIGWGIDSAAGADNKYPEVSTLTLIPGKDEDLANTN